MSSPNTVIVLENSRDAGSLSYLFSDPVKTLSCTTPDTFEMFLQEAEIALNEGLYLAGFLSFEAGYLLEPRLERLRHPLADLPIAWFGAFKAPQILDRAALEELWRQWPMGRTGTLSELSPTVTEDEYARISQRIHAYLQAGDIYQVNYTFDLQGRLRGSLLPVHARLRLAQPVAYGAFLSTPGFAISCHSPEVFLERHDDTVATRPMKGTAPRGRTWEEDNQRADALSADEKSKAENLMIVDLLRNDLSRIADGKVSVDRLYEVERYPSVLQMTSRIQAPLARKLPLRDLLRATFPCGSVTGAPKIRAMEIISELEGRARGVYTGAIGYISPSRQLCLNVAIRTLAVSTDGRVRFGTGSGIVADSNTRAEFDECALKANFLDEHQPPPALIETIRWQPADGYWLKKLHLDRLAESAAYFGYSFDKIAADNLLSAHAESMQAQLSESGRAESLQPTSSPQRVRLLLDRLGALSITSRPLPEPDAPSTVQHVAMSSIRVSSDNRFLYHKTTRRAVYDRGLREARSRNLWDLLYCNERGELTEGARSNLFVQLDGVLYTPPIESGLLPGTFRHYLLNELTQIVRERILLPTDLHDAEQIFVGNALYGLVAVKLVQDNFESH